MHQNLIYIASIPGHGITQVRMHWLLDLANVSLHTENGTPLFNFSALDTLIDRLHDLGLKPGFELMGNPFPGPLDFEQREDLERWKDMVATLARHFIERYGIDYVTQWNFESWNEPDHQGYGKNFTERGI